MVVITTRVVRVAREIWCPYGDSNSDQQIEGLLSLPLDDKGMAPAVGIGPTTSKLTASRSTTELRWNEAGEMLPLHITVT